MTCAMPINMKTLGALSAIILAILLIIPSAHAKETGQKELQDILSEAEELFQQANERASEDVEAARELYQRSILRFERIIREGGIQNGKLYYNIGNAYFRMEDLGRAMLNYLRAQEYIPNDPNLRQNLDYLRSKRIDKIPEPQKSRVLKTIFFWHYDISTKTRAIIFTLCFILFWVGASMRYLLRRQRLGWLIAVTGILSSLLFASLITEMVVAEKRKLGVIVSPEVIARKGDSATYEPSFKDPLHAGTEFRLIEDRGEWLQIRLPDSRTCWLRAKDIELVKKP
jgi:tetratricopeptide (TPR) repeat protein